MLIGDLEYFEGKANLVRATSGMDCPESCVAGATWWHSYPYQDFDYQFNSWGFRGPEYEQHIGKPVNICLGDSFTVNMGGPIEHSWSSQLAQHLNIPTLNLGMDGAGNDAIKLVYDRACEIFDVQNTFVMYTYLHRRLAYNNFTLEVHNDSKNFKYFLEQRIPNSFECALPIWTFNDNEMSFLNSLGLYAFNESTKYYADYKHIVDQERELYISKNSYNNLRSNEWPTYKQFIEGAPPHPDMLTKEFGNFLNNRRFCINRDGHHLNKETNKIYADCFFNQWKQKNES